MRYEISRHFPVYMYIAKQERYAGKPTFSADQKKQKARLYTCHRIDR